MHSFNTAMTERFPIDLAITVGHLAMIGTGLVIASADPIAADVVGAKLLGFSANTVHYL
jgi:hypothetical protein